MFESSLWIPVRDGDPRALALFRRHYSSSIFGRRRKHEERRFVGPGERLVLLTADCRSLFVWKYFVESNQVSPRGVNCAIFRREGGPFSASDLISDAETWAWDKWPGERLYTYVAPWALKSSNPGYCFIMAGWNKHRVTGRGLIEFEKYPSMGESNDC